MQPRIHNRTIIGAGLALCIALAVLVAWLLGVFERSDAML
jgi:hypothetical protein